MGKPLRIAFMGTPNFVIPTIESLLQSDHELVCVYTQPPREKGRKRIISKTPVHDLADQNNIETYHPENFKLEDDVELFQSLDLDLAIVAAYGLLLPQKILDAPKHGCINIHPSLLPKWRGPTPVQYAIWKGDEKTGVTVMQLEKGMDSGPILAQDNEAILSNTTFESLNKTLWQKGTMLLKQVLDDLAMTGQLKAQEQNHEAATYCKLLAKQNGQIDWKQSAQAIDRQIRGLNPWPGTFSFLNNKRIKILKAQPIEYNSSDKAGTIVKEGFIVCGQNTALKLLAIQPENKNMMDIQTAINGHHIKAGDAFS